MNTTLITIHWISMFIAITGGIMLAVWLFKNTKKKVLLTYIIAAIIVGLLGSYLTFQSEIRFMTTLLGRYGTVTSVSQMMGTLDAHFIERMIPHHEDAILMADIALEKAQHLEIKQLARDIQRTQSSEIEQMRTWYESWFGKKVPDVFYGTRHGMGSGMMHMGMMGDMTDVDSLKMASDFDKEFIEQMIPHHQMAVMMAQMLENATNRPEMKQLAQDIIDAQTREMNSMRAWYRQWYSD